MWEAGQLTAGWRCGYCWATVLEGMGRMGVPPGLALRLVGADRFLTVSDDPCIDTKVAISRKDVRAKVIDEPTPLGGLLVHLADRPVCGRAPTAWPAPGTWRRLLCEPYWRFTDTCSHKG